MIYFACILSDILSLDPYLFCCLLSVVSLVILVYSCHSVNSSPHNSRISLLIIQFTLSSQLWSNHGIFTVPNEYSKSEQWTISWKACTKQEQLEKEKLALCGHLVHCTQCSLHTTLYKLLHGTCADSASINLDRRWLPYLGYSST